jgi:hypothetical protein
VSKLGLEVDGSAFETQRTQEDFAEERKGRLFFATFAENFALFAFKSLP